MIKTEILTYFALLSIAMTRLRRWTVQYPKCWPRTKQKWRICWQWKFQRVAVSASTGSRSIISGWCMNCQDFLSRCLCLTARRPWYDKPIGALQRSIPISLHAHILYLIRYSTLARHLTERPMKHTHEALLLLAEYRNQCTFDVERQSLMPPGWILNETWT